MKSGELIREIVNTFIIDYQLDLIFKVSKLQINTEIKQQQQNHKHIALYLAIFDKIISVLR